jgi:hypothetical protein
MRARLTRAVPSLRLLRRSRAVKSDDGMTTAEYAVGTVAAASFAGILIKLLTSAPVQELIMKLIEKALSLF